MMDQPRITIQLIADKAHVSKSLVSKVLNEKEVRVSTQKRAQILKLANSLGYKSSFMKHAVVNTKNNKVIALIQPALDFDFILRMTNAISAKVRENGYSLIIWDSGEDSSIERQSLEICRSMNVAGILLNPCNNAENTDYFEMLTAENFPLVFLDRYIDNPAFSFVTSKNADAMFNLTERLIMRGHKNLLSIVQDKSTLTNVSMERLKGYYKAIDKYGLSGYNEIIYPDRNFKWQPLYSLLTSARRFSAFIINTSWDMRYFSELLNETDYPKCGNIEVGIFDDFTLPYTEMIRIQENTVVNNIKCIVRQDPVVMGECAVDILLDQIKKGVNKEPVHIFSDCDILEL